jgi:hypothetical protein
MAKILSDFPNLPDLDAVPPLPELPDTTDAGTLAGARATRERIEGERERLIELRRRLYGGVFDDLERAGDPLPEKGPEEITRAELLEHLQLRAGARIEREALTDPEGRYKPGASDEEIHATLHGAWTKPMPPKPGSVEDVANKQAAANAQAEGKEAPDPLLVDEPQVARIAKVLEGLPYAPNEVTIEDVRAARR